MRIPLSRPVIPQHAVEAASRALGGGWPGPGPIVEQFECAFAEQVGARHVVAVSSGTAALHLAVKLLDLPAGAEVITTPITFVATNQVLLYEGLRPRFADVELDTGNLCPDAIEASITPGTRAIMVMHYAGQPCELEAIYGLAARHGLAVIEDCAHAAGASYRGNPIGSHDGFQAFSFQATKNLPMVGGGALCLPRAELAERARRLRWMGIDRSTHERTTPSTYEWEYGVDEVGYRYTLNDYQAALGLSQLPELDAMNARRAARVGEYRKALSDLPGLCLLAQRADRRSSHHLFALRCAHRDALIERLAERGIGAGVHYKRNDLYPMFETGVLPNAETFWRQIVSLPLHLELTSRDVEEVVDAVRSVVGSGPS